MSGSISIWPQMPGFSREAFGSKPEAAPPPPQTGAAPAVAQDVRARMLDSVYEASYAKAMPREVFDAKTAGMSDKKLADAVYDEFYKGKLDRAAFNQRVGLASADGSTAGAIVQGATFGLSDEMGAAALTAAKLPGTLLSGRIPSWEQIGGSYDKELSARRENADVFRENNPYLGRGLEFLGGLATGGALKTAAGVAAPTVMQTATTAAKAGAVSGFGDAEGGWKERVEGAGMGAALGGAIGLAAVPVMKGGSLLLGRAGRALGIGDSEKTASQLLLKAFRDDGIPPDQIAARMDAWQASGAKPEALFDLGGENVRRLARTSAGRSGPGTDRAAAFLEGRQADQAGRVAGDVETTLGQSADDFHAALGALKTQRSTTAAPKYEAAFTRITPTADEYAKVARFVNDPIGQDALQKGLRIAELEHLARGEPFNPATFGVVRGEGGRFVIQPDTVPNLRFMDAVKRGYDDIVEGFRSPVTGRLQLDQYGRAVNDARAAYTGTLREMYPRYGGALDAWGGPSQMIDAANRGRGIFNLKDAEIAGLSVSARANPAEAEAFRLGVAQAIRDRIANTQDGADVVKRFFGSPRRRELLAAAFPNKAAFDAFEALMKREASMYRNAQFVSPRTGSQTALRQADDEGFGGQAVDIAGDLAMSAALPGHSIGGALRRGLSDLAARGRGITPGTADALAARLFTSDPAAIRGTGGLLAQTEINNALAQEAARRQRGLLLPGLASGVNVAR